MRSLLLLLFCLQGIYISAQTNILITDPTAEQVLMGNYDPAQFNPANISHHDSIIRGINEHVSPDSLMSYLVKLVSFENRNSGSDTTSPVTGIGAARNWALDKFTEFSAANNGRLIPAFFQFDQYICAVEQHRNIIAVLPGADTTEHSVIIIEGHIDSRCSGVCDITCMAQGAEDNGSGTALVLELARVMSRYSFDHTIIFMLTTGEEQGLVGANAFAKYVFDNNIPVKAVLNNDVIGGIICGETSSPPSCPGVGDIDSTNVRLFSYGGANSVHKGLARFIKLQYREELLPIVSVPMNIHIMTPEDRSGRGGDHIPFRQRGYPAVRFTAANEHGDASNGPGYDDRQHTEDDILGLDLNNDGTLDTLFVDLNYLSRNAVINGVAAGMAAIGPKRPLIIKNFIGNDVEVIVTDQAQYPQYKIGIRSATYDFDTVFFMNGSTDTIPAAHFPNNPSYISVAAVDNDGIESLFSNEIILLGVGIEEPADKPYPGVQLLQNRPNPFDEATNIGIYLDEHINYRKAAITIRDSQGRIIKAMDVALNKGVNEFTYYHGYHHTGIYTYTLTIDGVMVETKKMVFAN